MKRSSEQVNVNAARRIEAVARDVIARCDEISNCAKKPTNRLSECFAIARVVSFNETCAQFLQAVAESESAADVRAARKTLERMNARVMLANQAIAARLGDDKDTLDGVICCEKTFFRLLVKGDPTMRILARFAASHLTLIRIVLTAALTNVRKRLESIERNDEVKVGKFSFKALQQLLAAIRGRPEDKAEALAFMRSLYESGEPEFDSCHKVVAFVRNCTNTNDPYFNQCTRIRTIAKTFAKKVHGGEEKFWRSLAQELKPSHGKSGKKRT